MRSDSRLSSGQPVQPPRRRLHSGGHGPGQLRCCGLDGAAELVIVSLQAGIFTASADNAVGLGYRIGVKRSQASRQSRRMPG